MVKNRIKIGIDTLPGSLHGYEATVRRYLGDGQGTQRVACQWFDTLTDAMDWAQTQAAIVECKDYDAARAAR